jgi:hypothetical protein
MNSKDKKRLEDIKNGLPRETKLNFHAMGLAIQSDDAKYFNNIYNALSPFMHKDDVRRIVLTEMRYQGLPKKYGLSLVPALN